MILAVVLSIVLFIDVNNGNGTGALNHIVINGFGEDAINSVGNGAIDGGINGDVDGTIDDIAQNDKAIDGSGGRAIDVGINGDINITATNGNSNINGIFIDIIFY
jgi:hypothetical protein